MKQEQQIGEGNIRKKEEVQAYNPQVPFSQRLEKANLEEQFSRFLNIFEKIEINIPYYEALTQMPHYAKFMKDILSKKRKIAEEGVVSLQYNYPEIFTRENARPRQLHYSLQNWKF